MIRHILSLAAVLVASQCLGGETPAPVKQASKPYVHRSLVAAAQRRQTGGRLDMAAFQEPEKGAAKENLEPPSGAEADPFADPSPPEEMPGDKPSAPPEPPAEEGPATRPPDDLFTAPPESEPAAAAPSEPDMPFVEPPEQAPTRQRAAPRGKTPMAPPPAAPTRPSPSRQAPPRSTPKSAPPRELEPALQPEPEYLPSENGEGEPLYDEGFVDGEFADDCMSCAQAAGCCSLWDSYCPPPLYCRVPRGSWANIDYLAWFSRGASLPALVTTGSQGGAMNDPNLKVLYGDNRVDNGIRSGGRLNIGTCFNDAQTFGVGGTLIALQNMASNFNIVSDGSPIVARPFFSTATQAPDSFVVAQTGIDAGGVRVRTTNSFIAADTYFRRALAFGPRRRFDLIAGWQFLELDDSIGISDRAVSTDPNSSIPLGTTLIGFDGFRAANKFNGGLIGIETERRGGVWSLTTSSKVGLGNMHQTAIINGYSSTTVPGETPSYFAGGLLAQPSNIGRYDRNVFTAIPQFAANLGLQVTPKMRVTFGYSLIYIGHVAQAARQIDTVVDPSQIGGGPVGTAPTFSWQQNSYWLQGMNLGLNFRY